MTLYNAIRTVYDHTLRRLLPKYPMPYNGIEAPDQRAPLDRTKEVNHKPPFMQAIRDHVEEKDVVVMVGAGRGISAVAAANQDAWVILYEPSKKYRKLTKKTLRHNEVDDRVDVVDVAVGSVAPQIRDEWSINPGEFRLWTPAELHECEVLVLDCEGAEAEILRDMVISPRKVIVEVHTQFDVSLTDIWTVLEDQGYRHSYLGSDSTVSWMLGWTDA